MWHKPILILLGLFLAAPVMADPEISKLPEGPYLGMIVGFDDLTPEADEPDREGIAQARFDEAIDAGMMIGRAQLDWRDLETAPGVYDAAQLAEALAFASHGRLGLFVTFSSIDTDALTLPRYLSDENDMPFDGHRLSDPEIEAPYLAFLDWFIPELEKYNVWGLAIGNEVDAPINDNVITQKEALHHLLTGAAHIRTLDPELAVTVTLSGNANRTLPDFTDALVSGLDIVSFNTYCLNDYLTVSQPDEWAHTAKRWKKTAGDKQIFIQELGCPVGYGGDVTGPFADLPNGINGSDEIQAAFLSYYIDLLKTDPQFRAATVFQLYDWSPALAGIYNDVFEAAGEPVIGARLQEWLASVGLCRWSDAQCRPAWDVFLAAQHSLREG